MNERLKGVTMEHMGRKLAIALWATALLPACCLALRPGPNKAKLAAETQQIRQMAAQKDIDGLIGMLSTGEFLSKEAAAEHLGEIGDDRALPELTRLNRANGGWTMGFVDDDRSGAFAVAICRILTRGLSEEEQVEALFDLLEGRGPAVPENIEPVRMVINGVLREVPRRLDRNWSVGKRVADELDKSEDPSILARLRRSENPGVAPYAVWREVRGMDVESAIAHCQQIARDEEWTQSEGAIHCLEKFGPPGVKALDRLAWEGYAEAVAVLGNQNENPEIFSLLCWHLANNRNSRVRSRAVFAVSYVRSDALQVQSLEALIGALYDPTSNTRRNAATALSNRAYPQNKAYFEQIEDSLLVALKHPDPDVRAPIRKGLERLGCQRLDAVVPDPPPIRTDLEERSRSPLTAEQRLKPKIDAIEKDASRYLKEGPPEKAAALYEELLHLKAGHEPYQRALATARAYVQAAAETNEPWYPDAPYVDLKGRYCYALARKTLDVGAMKEAYQLAQVLHSTRYEGWTPARPDTDDPKGRDQYLKALKLYEHIVACCPANEFIVLCSRQCINSLTFALTRERRYHILAQIETFAACVEDMVDSARGTNVRWAFEQRKTDELREEVISLCTRDKSTCDLLDVILERCVGTDPKIVELAQAAKARIITPR